MPGGERPQTDVWSTVRAMKLGPQEQQLSRTHAHGGPGALRISGHLPNGARCQPRPWVRDGGARWVSLQSLCPTALGCVLLGHAYRELNPSAG